MSDPHFTRSMYASELDLLKAKSRYYQEKSELLEKGLCTPDDCHCCDMTRRLIDEQVEGFKPARELSEIGAWTKI